MIAEKLKALAEQAARPADPVLDTRLYNLKAGVLDVLDDINRQLFNDDPGRVISDLLGDRKEARQ